MSTPDTNDVHVNAALSQISIAFANADGSYIADRVFPFVYVDKQSDIYAKYGRGAFFADGGAAMVRAPGTNAAETGFTVDLTNTFFCLNFAIGMPIPVELRGNADAVFDLDMDATRLVTQMQLIRRERAFAVDFMGGSVWTGSSTGSDIAVANKWSDYGASDPIGDIRTQIRSVQLKTGNKPNKLVMGQIVWDRLADHPDLIDRIKGGATTGNPAIAQQALLAQILGLEEVLVGSAVYNSADENQSVSNAFIMDDDALLIYTPRTPGRLMPSAGYTFVWRTLVNGADSPQYIRKITETRPMKDIVEAFSYWDQVAVEPLSGAFFSDCVD